MRPLRPMNINSDPFHFPLITGMVPHKTKRGQQALKRLKVVEGVPPEYAKKKAVCVPLAMRLLCLRPDRKFCTIGRLSHEVGWHYADVIRNLENKRKAKDRVNNLRKTKLRRLTTKAKALVAPRAEKLTATINALGYN